MRTHTIVAALLAIALQGNAQTMKPASTPAGKPKLSARLQRVARQQALQSTAQLQPVIIKCDDAKATAGQLRSLGIRATAVSTSLVSARIPARDLHLIEQIEGIGYAVESHQMSPLLTETRQEMGVDRLHQGDQLETPFTGKGVVVGVIDQGFEYRHLAVLKDDEKTPRVLAVWDRSGYSKGQDAAPITDIPASGDGLQSSGHAMHVTNIAAGSHIKDNDFYGMAPEADIIMIPSEFSDAELLEDVSYIQHFADSLGKPWVINMSFGSSLGSHDGKDNLSQFYDQLLSEKPGRMICVASGNEGQRKNHLTYTFTQPHQTIALLANPGIYGTIGEIWSQLDDGQQHLTVRPFLLKDATRDYRDADFWRPLVNTSIAPYNNKEVVEFAVGQALQGYQLGIELTADAPLTIHAWTNSPYYGEFATTSDEGFVCPDGLSSISGYGACAERVVTVANYIASNSYKNSKGVTIDDSSYGQVGDINNTSGTGPALCDTPKPTIAAPGTSVKSALSKYGGLNTTASNIVQDVKRGIKHFYYGAITGTSMATPAVTGTIALWLQANPRLTNEQIHQILQQTARHDEYTGDASHSPEWGYGKLDAYEGLKMALQLGDANGIPTLQTTRQPFTLLRQADQWRVLMNSNESTVSLTVSTLSGTVVQIKDYAHLCRGQEFLLPLHSLPCGVYVVVLSAGKSRQTYKLCVAPKQ